MRKKRLSIKSQIKLFLLFCIVSTLYLSAQEQEIDIYTAGRDASRAAWMREAKWGVMNHYLADWKARELNIEMSVEKWNELVNGFDVEGLAEQVESVGAGYYLISIGQNSGYYLSPNSTYDKYVGIQPGKCSERDLVADLYEALHKRNIKLMVYLPAGAPGQDDVAREKLEWQSGPHRNRQFQIKWESVIREWSERWGEKVDGWWFDGCFFPNSMYRFRDAPNFETFAAAARAGNPNSAIAFNPSLTIRISSVSPYEDYSGGEVVFPERMEISRVFDGMIDGVQLHVLSRLGERWGMGEPRFTTEKAIEYSKKVTDAEGVVTWDVPVQANGLMKEEFLKQMRAINKAVREEKKD